MSQTPERVAVEKIMEIIGERPHPVVRFGLPEVPRRSKRKLSDEVVTALKMLQRGEPGATMDYPTPDAARKGARVLMNYRGVHDTPIHVCKRDCRVYVWPTKAPIKR